MGIAWLNKDERRVLKELKRNGLNVHTALRNINRTIAIYPTADIQDQAERYVSTDDVFSIIRMLATTAANVPIRVYEVTKEDEVELDDTDEVANLLNNPNEQMGRFEFYYALYTFLFYSGNCLIYKEKPELGTNAGKTVSLSFLYPQNITINVSESLPRRIVSYNYRVDGVLVYENIPVEDVIHIRNFNPDLDITGQELWGLSILSVLARRLTQNDSIRDVQTAQMQNGGVETIVADKGDGMTSVDGIEVSVAGQRKKAYYQHIKEPSNKSVPFMANGDITVHQVGSTLADLKVIESAKVNFSKLCNAFGTSDILFNNNDASTESNVKEMVKRTYTNTILPDVCRVRDAFKRGLLPEFKDKKRTIKEDISEIPELQENMKEKAEIFAALPIFRPNDALEAFGYGREKDPLMDKYYIKTGYEDIEQMNMGVPDLPEGPDQ